MSICGVLILLANAYLYITHAPEKYSYMVIFGILLAGVGGSMVRKSRTSK